MSKNKSILNRLNGKKEPAYDIDESFGAAPSTVSQKSQETITQNTQPTFSSPKRNERKVGRKKKDSMLKKSARDDEFKNSSDFEVKADHSNIKYENETHFSGFFNSSHQSPSHAYGTGVGGRPEKDYIATPHCRNNEPSEKPVANTDYSGETSQDFYAQFEKDVDAADKEQTIREQREHHYGMIIRRAFTCLLIAGCIYLIFLIYGALNTKYIYENGKIVPQKMSVQQITELAEFEEVALMYRQSRMLYEEILRLDYRMAKGVEDPLLLAPEYQELLDDISSLVIQFQAINVPQKYALNQNQIVEWVHVHAAAYCQNMSGAITENNAKKANEAIAGRNYMYEQFSIITENVAKIGNTVYGADISDIKNWSPEKFVSEELGDAGSELDE